jgi:N-succinyldiaminopimelate aminotransferase
MNPLLKQLQPYPFERWRALTRDVAPVAGVRSISLGIGEPRHPAPAIVLNAIREELAGLSNYPATQGEPVLREACAQWVQRRYGVYVNPHTQVLPVNGSREALFALAQTVIDPTCYQPIVVCPNPFYQIYEGAALLAGAQTCFANSQPEQNFAVNWESVSPEVWRHTQLLYVCSPGNPTGAVMPLAEWEKLFDLSDRFGFVIAADECYSEIYFDEHAPPLGALQAAQALGRSKYDRLIAFTSLSKRSNVPGLRSGFVCGDEKILKDFLLYRTYHGSAMSPVVQRASAVAWGDEAHVLDNRTQYRIKFEQVVPILASKLNLKWPEAGFYLWADVSGLDLGPVHRGTSKDVEFAVRLLKECNVTVLPGSFLAREAQGVNPGEGRVRMALVAELSECLEAANRIADFVNQL